MRIKFIMHDFSIMYVAIYINYLFAEDINIISKYGKPTFIRNGLMMQFSKKNWFVTNNFRDKDVDYMKYIFSRHLDTSS